MSEGPDFDDMIRWEELTPAERREELIGCGCQVLILLIVLTILVVHKI